MAEKNRQRVTNILFVLAVFALSCNLTFSSLHAADEPAPSALPGEALLSPADAEKILHELPAFKDPKPIKARIKTEVDDLLGARTDEGDLLLDRPARVLRRFTKPSLKIWLLDGTQIQEYASRTKTLYVKDFAKAPRAASPSRR